MKGPTPQCNTPLPANAKKEDKVRLVIGNQEDIDLVVVAHEPAAKTYDLILFEAKALRTFRQDTVQKKDQSPQTALRVLHGAEKGLTAGKRVTA